MNRIQTQLRQNKWLGLVNLAATSVIVLAACVAPPQAAPPAAQNVPAASNSGNAGTSDPIYIGVSGPLTGQNARYGEQWKKGFDLALEEINGKGGIQGRKLEYIFEDSQSDPKQSVVVAQKFVADPRIIIELGDFSSGASMAASKIYERAKLVQFGFTNSHPDFTAAGGEYTWSNSNSQKDSAPALAEYAVNRVGVKKLAVFSLNTDWGKTSFDLFAAKVKALGAEIVANESYVAEEKDFKSALTRIREAQPDGIVLISYQADAALISQQVAAAGLSVPIIASGSNHSPDFIKLGGKAVEGVYVQGGFLPDNPEPRIKNFVDKYRAKYNETPDTFAVHAYDTIILIAEAIKVGGPTREGIKDALPKLKDVPSVEVGSVTFNPETRRTSNPNFVDLIVKNGEFVAWDGKQASR